MNKLILLTSVAILSFGALSESLADNSATSTEDTTQTQEMPKILPNSGSCGDGCLYQITTDKDGARNLRVYNDPDFNGISNIQEYAFSNTIYGASNATFDKIIIDGDFDTIGQYAFKNTTANNYGSKNLIFNGNVKNIEGYAFWGNKFSAIEIPNSVETIAVGAFAYNYSSLVSIPGSVSIENDAFNNNSFKNIIIEDNLINNADNWSMNAFSNLNDGNANFICKGDMNDCKTALEKYLLPPVGTCVDNNNAYTKCFNGNIKFQPATETQCNSANYYWNGVTCLREENPKNRECVGGYAKIDDRCVDPLKTFAKKHYTPAEAAKWLHDGNDNFVIITFKK